MLTFVKIVKDVYKVDTPCRSSNLKQRLKKRFPQQQFIFASQKGYIVYSGSIDASDLVNGALEQMSTDQDNQDSEAEEINISPCTPHVQMTKTIWEQVTFHHK